MSSNQHIDNHVATLANLGGQFTEQRAEVFCDFIDGPAGTNFDGGTHFCQHCGATNHPPVVASSSPSRSAGAR